MVGSLNALFALSPAVRKLVISNPKTVEAAVAHIKSVARRDEHCSLCDRKDDCETCDDLWDEMVEYEQAAIAALAKAPEGET